MKLEDLKEKHFDSLVNVSQLLKEPIGSRRRYNVQELVDQQGKDSLEGEVTLIRSSQGILVTGHIIVRIELTCSRCLNTFLCPVSSNIEEEFLSEVYVPGALPDYSLEESSGFVVDSDHLLDLGEAIRQYTLLNLPMKPLCRPDCTEMKEIRL
jgi:uncharacterized protein